jgi:hypothetical protein
VHGARPEAYIRNSEGSQDRYGIKSDKSCCRLSVDCPAQYPSSEVAVACEGKHSANTTRQDPLTDQQFRDGFVRPFGKYRTGNRFPELCLKVKMLATGMEDDETPH